jgi:hypothetical protein
MISFSSPPTTRWATVEIFDTPPHGVELPPQSSCVRSSLYSSGRTHRKHRFLYGSVLNHRCRDVFTAQCVATIAARETQRTPLATPLLMLRNVTAFVTRSSAACVRAFTKKRLFLCLHRSCFEQTRHNIFTYSSSGSSGEASNLGCNTDYNE